MRIDALKENTYLTCIELSLAARRDESSGGSSLHKDKAPSKSPEAVNCTICKAMNIWRQIISNAKITLPNSSKKGNKPMIYRDLLTFNQGISTSKFECQSEEQKLSSGSHHN